MNVPMRMSEDCIFLALRCVDVRRRSRFRPLMTRSSLSQLMWTYRVNSQTIVSTVVPTMSRTSGAFRFVVGFFCCATQSIPYCTHADICMRTS